MLNCSSVFLLEAKAENLVTAFYKGMTDLNSDLMLQVGMDGPATNHKALRIIQSSRSEAGLHMLIDIGTCSLHIVSGAFRTGDNCDDFWEI